MLMTPKSVSIVGVVMSLRVLEKLLAGPRGSASVAIGHAETRPSCHPVPDRGTAPAGSAGPTDRPRSGFGTGFGNQPRPGGQRPRWQRDSKPWPARA